MDRPTAIPLSVASLCFMISLLGTYASAEPPPSLVNSTTTPNPAGLLFEEARQLLILKRGAQAETRLRSFLDANPVKSPRTLRAQIMLANAAIQQGLGERALEALDGVNAKNTPAPDLILWILGQAQTLAGQPLKALSTFQRLTETYPNTKAAFEASAAIPQVLFGLERYREANLAFDALLKRFPEYPQRHIALYQKAQCQLLSGDGVQGRKTMQTVWFEYPWKEEGLKARVLLDAWQLLGTGPPPPSFDKRLERARTLRRNKHWQVAEEALDSLLDSIEPKTGDNEKIINEVNLQRALVAYERQDYRAALPQLQSLEHRTRNNKGAGLTQDFIQRLLQRCHHRMGNSELAEAMLRRRMKDRSSNKRDKELAEFYWKDSQYKKAWKLFERTTKDKDKVEWMHTFRAYKAGEFKRARRNLKALLQSDRNKSNRFRYRYWLARTFQQEGRADEATDRFRSLASEDPLGYYGIQAVNRLIDMDVKKSSACKPLRHTVPLSWQDLLTAASDDVANPISSPTPQSEEGGPTLHSSNQSSLEGSDDRCDVDPTSGDIKTRTARVYWDGAENPPAVSPLTEEAFRSLSPDQLMTAYLNQDAMIGALRRFADRYSDLWPNAARAAFLHELGLAHDAQLATRAFSLEYRRLVEALQDGDSPTDTEPLTFRDRRWHHLIDHRKEGRRGFWGLESSERRYPRPRTAKSKRDAAKRQLNIIGQRETLEPMLRAALMEVGDYYTARRLRLLIGGWDRRSTQGDSRLAWTELHPRAFPLLVQKYAAIEGLSPYILWALMTVESSYNPDSVSYADARGLLQVIPKTGNKVAYDIKDNTFGEYELLAPETSVRHGAWYFSRLVHKFHGQEPFAIASYNGGPHNVQRWLRHKDHIVLDEFVEEIPFRQARGYTKKVLRFLALYKGIYEESDGLYVGQRIDPSVRVAPRY